MKHPFTSWFFLIIVTVVLVKCYVTDDEIVLIPSRRDLPLGESLYLSIITNQLHEEDSVVVVPPENAVAVTFTVLNGPDTDTVKHLITGTDGTLILRYNPLENGSSFQGGKIDFKVCIDSSMKCAITSANWFNNDIKYGENYFDSHIRRQNENETPVPVDGTVNPGYGITCYPLGAGPTGGAVTVTQGDPLTAAIHLKQDVDGVCIYTILELLLVVKYSDTNFKSWYVLPQSYPDTSSLLFLHGSGINMNPGTTLPDPFGDDGATVEFLPPAEEISKLAPGGVARAYFDGSVILGFGCYCDGTCSSEESRTAHYEEIDSIEFEIVAKKPVVVKDDCDGFFNLGFGPDFCPLEEILAFIEYWINDIIQFFDEDI